jgi:hypothetical protein
MQGAFSAGSRYESGEEPELPEMVFGPAGASQHCSDGLGTEGLPEIMVDQKHSASVRVLVEMVRASMFSWPKPVALYSSLPILGTKVS